MAALPDIEIIPYTADHPRRSTRSRSRPAFFNEQITTVITPRDRRSRTRSVAKPVAPRGRSRTQSTANVEPKRRGRPGTRSRSGSNPHMDETIALAENFSEWSGGRFIIARPNDIERLTDLVQKLNGFELKQFDIILKNFAIEQDKKSFAKVIKARKWELDPANVRRNDLPLVDSDETADLAIFIAFFAEEFDDARIRIEQLRNAAIEKYKLNDIQKRRFKTLVADVNKLKKDFTNLYNELHLKLNDSGKRYLKGKKIGEMFALG